MRKTVEELVSSAIQAAIDSGELSAPEVPDPCIERPRDLAHGDWASSVALKGAKVFRKKPAETAQIIANRLTGSELIDDVEVAGPGFINIKLAPAALQSTIAQVRRERADFGRCNLGQGKKVNVEFVSANPTGPLHVGHGRWAVLGDCICNVLDHAGWDVTRENYINDAGNQMNVFANSVAVRYLQLYRLVREQGMTLDTAQEELVADTALEEDERKYASELGEHSYGGAYIVDIARMIADAEGDIWVDRDPDEREVYFRERSYTQVLDHMHEIIDEVGTHFDVWFSERTLHAPDETGKSAIDRAIDKLRADGYVFEKDGAVWFRSTDLGDDKDRVLIKADGDCTYFAADVAYMLNKFSRGFERVLLVLGADHHGYIGRMDAICKAFGHEPGFDNEFAIILGQLVNLLRDGKPVRLSKRAGTMITFEELLEEVGCDATRYLMIAKSADQPIDFDIEAAKKQDNTNPVYYVQYAHARICSILRKVADQRGIEVTDDMDALVAGLIADDVDLSLLCDPAEFDLMRKLDEFPEIVESAARDCAPYRLTHYAESLAATFHAFYTQCRVISDDEALTNARLAAVDAARIALSLALSLLGVNAPVRM